MRAQTFSQALASGQPWRINCQGRYFRLLETDGGEVNVSFFRSGSEVGRAEMVAAGLGLRLDFDAIEVLSGSAQVVRLFLSDAEVTYDPPVLVQQSGGYLEPVQVGGMNYEALDQLIEHLPLMEPTLTSQEIEGALLFADESLSGSVSAMLYTLTADVAGGKLLLWSVFVILKV